MRVCSECGSPQLVPVYPGCWECAACGGEVDVPVVAGEPAEARALAYDDLDESENPRFGFGNPDFDRDFERTREP